MGFCGIEWCWGEFVACRRYSKLDGCCCCCCLWLFFGILWYTQLQQAESNRIAAAAAVFWVRREIQSIVSLQILQWEVGISQLNVYVSVAERIIILLYDYSLFFFLESATVAKSLTGVRFLVFQKKKNGLTLRCSVCVYGMNGGGWRGAGWGGRAGGGLDLDWN